MHVWFWCIPFCELSTFFGQQKKNLNFTSLHHREILFIKSDSTVLPVLLKLFHQYSWKYFKTRYLMFVIPLLYFFHLLWECRTTLRLLALYCSWKDCNVPGTSFQEGHCVYKLLCGGIQNLRIRRTIKLLHPKRLCTSTFPSIKSKL